MRPHDAAPAVVALALTLSGVFALSAQSLEATANKVPFQAPLRPLASASPDLVNGYCAPTIPSSPAAYQSAFDQLRRVGDQWAGADGGLPISLPDGRVLWLFDDTFSGRIATDGSLAAGWRFINNSFVVQNGACFRPLMGGSPDARTEIIPNPSHGWYWPTSGIVEHTATGDVLRMFVSHETNTRARPPFNLRLIDMKIATFSLPDLTFVGIGPLPHGIHSDQTSPWGMATLVAGTTIYIYGTGTGPNATDPNARRNHRVARVPLGALTTGPWQFYDGATTGTNADWSTKPEAADSLTFVADSPALPQGAPSVKPWELLDVGPNPNGGYLAVGKLGELAADHSLYGTEISGWTAAAPQGPWHYAGKIAATSPQRHQFSYGARLELALPGGTPTISYSINSVDNLAKNIWLLGVKFETPDALAKLALRDRPSVRRSVGSESVTGRRKNQGSSSQVGPGPTTTPPRALDGSRTEEPGDRRRTIPPDLAACKRGATSSSSCRTS